VNSIATNWPREVCSAVSVAQTGVMAFRIPVPIPFKVRARAISEKLTLTVVWRKERTAEHPIRVLGRALKSCTDNGPHRSKSNSLDTSISVTEPSSEERSEQGARKIIDRDLLRLRLWCWFGDGQTDNASLKERLIDRDQALLSIIVAKAHCLSVVSVGVDTSHHTLVISEEEDGQASDGVDCYQECSFLVPASCIPRRNTIHICGIQICQLGGGGGGSSFSKIIEG